VIGVYLCAHSTHTYISRILFAYSRDNAVPLSSWWTKMNERTQSPLNAAHCVSFLTLILGVPMLGNTVN